MATASFRPAWVTGELVAQWCEWVRRDVTRHGEATPESAAVAPYDLPPTAAVPTCAPEDVASSVMAARVARPKSSPEGFVSRTKRQLALMRKLGVR